MGHKVDQLPEYLSAMQRSGCVIVPSREIFFLNKNFVLNEIIFTFQICSLILIAILSLDFIFNLYFFCIRLFSAKMQTSTQPAPALHVGHYRPHPAYVNEFLPAFPDPHTYIKTDVRIYK